MQGLLAAELSTDARGTRRLIIRPTGPIGPVTTKPTGVMIHSSDPGFLRNRSSVLYLWSTHARITIVARDTPAATGNRRCTT